MMDLKRASIIDDQFLKCVKIFIHVVSVFSKFLANPSMNYCVYSPSLLYRRVERAESGCQNMHFFPLIQITYTKLKSIHTEQKKKKKREEDIEA